MTEPSPYDPTNDTDQDTAVEFERPPSMPRWVKLLGIVGLISVLLVVIVMVLAGGQHGPGMHMPAVETPTQAPVSRGPETTGGVGGPADAAAATRTVEVATLDTMVFAPSSIDVSAGETVTFAVTNTGQVVHEFTLGDAAMQQQHADMMVHMPDGMAHDQPNSVILQPGESKQLTWQFGDARMLEYACHEPGHLQAGMRGQITVN